MSRRGVFLEFGGRDGQFESNTLLFEERFGWQGLLVEAGRDYIAALRQRRACQVHGRPGACVFAALDSEADRTLYWHTRDRVLPKLANTDRWRGQSWVPTRAERETTTTTIDVLLQTFGLQHIDLLAADCEGCEEAALRGLNLTHTTVDVLLVEAPTCGLAERLASHGYLAIPLWFSYDFVFLAPRTVGLMHRPPSLSAIPRQAKRLVGEANGHKKGADLLKACPQLKERIWEPDQPWPPAAAPVRGSVPP
eukprot:6397426-Prymnesium_polylepis.3